MKLSESRSGSVVMITEIDSDRSGALRLRELGVLEGVELKVIKAGNPILLYVNDSRIAMDLELAQVIQVESLVEGNAN